MKAKISEIFCSLQGEGIYYGQKQIFVRCARCNLDCAFCDEKDKRAGEDIPKEDLIRKIQALRNFSDIIAITGGEPLLETDFLTALLPDLKSKKFRIYLESNGTLPGKLDKIIDWLDIIAMDIKLPSATGLEGFWSEHLDFLRIAKKKRVFVKIVITAKTVTREIDKAVSIIAAVDKTLPLVLQPVTPQKGAERPTEKTLSGFRERMALSLTDVRIIGQLHRVWGVN